MELAPFWTLLVDCDDMAVSFAFGLSGMTERQIHKPFLL